MNILILTIFYPDNIAYPVSQTKAVHYWAKYLVNNNRIMVMHNRIQNATFLRSLKHEMPVEPFSHDFDVVDGVAVIRNDVVNYIPKYTMLTSNSVQKAVSHTINVLNERGFIPNVIVAHFCWQQRDIIKAISKRVNAPIIPVFHNIDVRQKRFCRNAALLYPYAGARSNRIKNEMVKNGYRADNVFVVNSGYPSFDQSDINNKGVRTNNGTTKFLFAGNLIKIKRVDDVIKVMGLIRGKYDFSFVIIGDGSEKGNLLKLCEKARIKDRVQFLGRLTREETIKQMKQADCFIMISKPETFGISYIEAMACKCFVIGSKGEGIDGVIIDGYNGLLAEPGNIDSIRVAVEKFLNENTENKKLIINRGFATAKAYSEEKVANDYYKAISRVLNIKC